MPYDRYEHLLKESARAAASNPRAAMDDIHTMPAIAGRAVEAHIRLCDACRIDGRMPVRAELSSCSLLPQSQVA